MDPNAPQQPPQPPPQQPGYPQYPQQPQYPPSQQPYPPQQQPQYPPQQPYSQPPPQAPYQGPSQPYPQVPPPYPPQPQPYGQPPQYAPTQPPYPTGPYPGAPYQPQNPTGYPAQLGGPMGGPPPSSGQSQRGVIITAISILVIAVLAGAGFVIYSSLNHHSTNGSTASNTHTTTTSANATATPSSVFTAREPAGGCADNGINGQWQNEAATGDKIECQAGQVAIITKTPTHTDDEIFFNGVQGQTFPHAYQAIVFVDIGQANNACAGVLVRANSAGYARFGFYVCGGMYNGALGFDEVIPYTATGAPINSQIVSQGLPEGVKTRYSLTVHTNGTTIAFDLDSHLVATKTDVQPGANDYVALAVDSGQDTAVGTDITYFANFSFTPLS